MTRFVMTLDEAVDLVMHAFIEGNNGEIFVQRLNHADKRRLSKL